MAAPLPSRSRTIGWTYLQSHRRPWQERTSGRTRSPYGMPAAVLGRSIGWQQYCYRSLSMKTTKLTSLLAATAFFAVPVSMMACSKSDADKVGDKIEERADQHAEKVVDNAKDRADSIRAAGEVNAEAAENAAEMAKERSELERSANERLMNFDKKMAEMEMKAKSLTGASLEQANASLTALKAEREQATVALTNVQTATGATWDQAKTGLDHALDELEAAYDKTEDLMD